MESINYAAADILKAVADMSIKNSGKNGFTKRGLAFIMGIIIALGADGKAVCPHDNADKHDTQQEAQVTIPDFQAERMRMDYWFTLGKDSTPENDTYMSDYAATLDSLDITVNIPPAFTLVADTEIRRPFIYSPNPNFVTKYFHSVNIWHIMGPVLESPTKDALFLYPFFIDMPGSPIHKMESELIVANENDDLDITPMIKHITGKDAQEISNADEMILYNYEMSEPVMGKFKHVAGVILRKKGHYPLGLNIIMDDEGLNKKAEYVKLLLDNVRYGDKPVAECVEMEKNNQLNTEPVKFPLKKIECHGLRKE